MDTDPNTLKIIANITSPCRRTLIAGAPSGCDALVVAKLAHDLGTIVFIGRDDVRMAQMNDALAFFAPDIECLQFPAWDCLPYDRVSPNGAIVASRIDTLTRLLNGKSKTRVVLTTVSALLQRVVAREVFAQATMAVSVGDSLDMEQFSTFLGLNGYIRSDTVMESGEFAVRGGILDVFPTGSDAALRLDFFGDVLESIRVFDSVSQLTTGKVDEFIIKPVSEVMLGEEAIARFRSGYRQLFGVPLKDDILYEAISAGRRHPGMEHWLALFHQRMETLPDYLGDAALVLDYQCAPAIDARLELINEYYQARRDIAANNASSTMAATGGLYNPLPIDNLYLNKKQYDALLVDRKVYDLSPFSALGKNNEVDAGGKPGRDFADARANPEINVFAALGDHIKNAQKSGKMVLVAAFSAGSQERLTLMMQKHGIDNIVRLEKWHERSSQSLALAVLAIEHGFSTPYLVVISEADILGERLSRRSRSSKLKPENFIAEASSLREGDMVVHADHGIGRYDGLINIDVAGASHDCLLLIYAGNDKLFLPVENIDLIGRYGSEHAGARLDRLGGAAWQARKARMKQRIRDMADELVKVAARRLLKPAAVMTADAGAFDEFCSRFAYNETEDQYRSIQSTIEDLASGVPSDRLICGDVGFGKTEVALRAAFVAALSGKQVAIVTPTTLLCRQHFQTFVQRFAGFPVEIAQLSRLVTSKKSREVKDGLKSGMIDIVIGTHALVARDVGFRDLGLLVIDEEQHFGVAHKERLKRLKSDVHVLTLTATPIPRTLQLALSGVRKMSLITTPPVDRLAVRTFIMPYDPLIIRQALLREHYRGGQSFYVCPRIADMDILKKQLAELVPEIKVAVAHGRLAPMQLEKIMTAFYEGAFDVLLSTNIIESGLDLPSVNTIIIHRADMFGLAQLYQLRGRVGRSKIRAYAYLCLPVRQKLSPSAKKRLEVMQTLDTLGAGFSLASHDLDIRGAGNLLGGEQSGHIREVGIELYQQMLEEAVAEARGVTDGDDGDNHQDDWSPQIAIGMPVLIPEAYVADLDIRLDLYRRIAGLCDHDEIESFAAEMIDRFGSLPQEVDNLLQTVAIKRMCLQVGVDKMEAGPKGAVVSFHNENFTNPQGLVEFITANFGTVKLRPDHKLVYKRAWEKPEERFAGVQYLLKQLLKIVQAAE